MAESRIKTGEADAGILTTLPCSLQKCFRRQDHSEKDETNASKFKNLALLPAEVLQKVKRRRAGRADNVDKLCR